MHESLKRPLFRKRAMEVYQARQGGKVPGYVIGGLIPPIMAGVRTAGPFIARQFARPNVQKGLLGIEAGTAGAGLEETRRGLSGEQSIFGDEPASISGGLATLAYPGIGTFGRTLPKAFPGSIRAAGAGEAITKKTPFLLPATLLGIPVGMAESQVRGAMKDEKETRLTDPKKAEELKNKLITLGPNPPIGQIFNTIDTFDLTDKQKNAAYNELKLTPEEIKSFRQTKSQAPQPQDQKTGVVGETTSDNAVKKNMTSVLDYGNASDMTPEEQVKTALKMSEKNNEANKEINAIQEKNKDNKDFQNQFNSLKSQVQSVTGNGDMTNLVLLKLASGLLTGKTTQRGAGGFLDVLGQASGPAVDTAIAIASQQRVFDNELASSLLKNMAAQQSGFKAESKRVYVRESNPGDELFPSVTRLVGKDKDTGTLLEITKTNQGEVLTPYVKGGEETEVDAKVRSVAERSMKDLSVGIEFANIVSNAPEELLGPGATARRFVDSIVGSVKSYQSAIGPIDQFSVKSFNEIEKNFNDPAQFEKLSDEDKKIEQKKSQQLLDKFKTESKKVSDELSDAMDSGDNELIARARLGLIEQRMKYIIANANKAADRLTAKDVESAAALTRIYSIRDNPKQIKKNYEYLAKTMNDNFKLQTSIFADNGGTKTYVFNNFANVPVIQEYRLREEAGAIKKTAKKDTRTILEGI